MANSADPDQLALFAKAGHIWVQQDQASRKHTYIILTSLNPIFYTVKLGFTWVYIIFLISTQKHRLWYLLEPSRRGSSNEYPQSIFWAEIWKISEFLSENFQVLVVKFSIYLNRCVIVMVNFMHTQRVKTFVEIWMHTLWVKILEKYLQKSFLISWQNP